MRKAVFTLLVFAGISQSAVAQAPNWANKMFEGDVVHDFGVVPRGVQLKYTFKIKNIWKVPLEISEPHPECGCVTIREYPRTLQPGEASYISLNMDGTRFSGQKTVKINILIQGRGTDQVFRSEASVTVHANARLDVVFNPGEIDFGHVPHGQALSKIIDVEYAGTQAWAVSTIFKSASAPFELKVEELPNRGIKGYRISATLKPDAPPGPFKQEVLLKTNDATSPTLTFNVLGTIQATLSVVPELVNLNPAKVGDTVARKIIVKGTRPFHIVGIDGQGDGLTVGDLPKNESPTQIVEIRFQPSQAGELKKQLTIRTDLNNEEVKVTILANGT
jgi:Protein of unknown function (DUF1573)